MAPRSETDSFTPCHPEHSEGSQRPFPFTSFRLRVTKEACLSEGLDEALSRSCEPKAWQTAKGQRLKNLAQDKLREESHPTQIASSLALLAMTQRDVIASRRRGNLALDG